MRTLFQHDVLSLREDGEFAYAHSEAGDIIAFILYREVEGQVQYMLFDTCRSFWFKRHSLTAYTEPYGGQDPLEVLFREVKKETGFKVPDDEGRVVFLGTCQDSKANDTTVRMYLVNVSGLVAGSRANAGNDRYSPVWLKEVDFEVRDPLVGMIFFKLLGWEKAAQGQSVIKGIGTVDQATAFADDK